MTALRHPDEAMAVRAVLHTAHERARALAAQLELEATDPRVRGLHERTRQLRQDIALLIIELTPDRSQPAPVNRDCHGCLVSLHRCEFDRSLGVGPCCDECAHG